MLMVEWKIKPLTPLHMGGVNGQADRVHETGLMGSLRWWYEVLVRGLGGQACDPTADGVRCPNSNVKDPLKPGHHCVVCELFGCTGWARKFRLMVLKENGEVMQEQIGAGSVFILRFIPLRPIRDEEWCLLDLTLRLIADYGAIGGRTVFKPSEEWGIADLGADDFREINGQVTVHHSRRGLPLQRDDVILEVEGSQITRLTDLEEMVKHKPHGERLRIKVRRSKEEQEIEVWAGKRHHQDLGLIHIEERTNDLSPCTLEQLKDYVQEERWRKHIPFRYQEDRRQYDYSWASLKNFWCVKERHLARQDATHSTFNQVVGRKQDKSIKERRGRRVIRWSDLFENRDDKVSRWLAGRQQESKKVFSFKETARTFGFIKPGLVDFEEMKRRLSQVWQDFNPDNEFLSGEQILEQLFQQEESA